MPDCACPHHDKYDCFRIRYSPLDDVQRAIFQNDMMEEYCECECHQEEDSDDA